MEHTWQGAWPGESRGYFLGRMDFILHGHSGQPTQLESGQPGRGIVPSQLEMRRRLYRFFFNPLETNARKEMVRKMMSLEMVPKR